MKGDKLVIQEGHVKAARRIAKLLLPVITEAEFKYIVSIGGESGSGKSEIAAALSDKLAEQGVNSIIMQQDDYFVYPPKTNQEMRRTGGIRIGQSEVRLALLDENLGDIVNAKPEIEKPLVLFDEDRITTETISLEGVKVVIVEGTYTTNLRNVHRRIFIDRVYVATKAARARRAREEQNESLEQVLRIEHDIISSHKELADIIVSSTYDVSEVRKRGHGGTKR